MAQGLSEAQKKKLTPAELSRYNLLQKRYSGGSLSAASEVAELNKYLTKGGYGRTVTAQTPKPVAPVAAANTPLPSNLTGNMKDPTKAADFGEGVFDLSKQELQRNQNVANPGQVTDIYGNSQSVTYDDQGRPIVKQTAGGAAGNANNAAQNILAGYMANPTDFNAMPDVYTAGDFEGTRKSVGDAIYNNSTRYLQQDQDTAMSSAKQELANKGIPYSDDPNSAYQRGLANVNRRFDAERQAARNDAEAQTTSQMATNSDVQMNALTGGITKANGGLNQAGAMGTVASQFSGNFQPYQSVQSNITQGILDAYGLSGTLANQKKQLELEQQKINKSGAAASGGGGSSSGFSTSVMS